MLIEPVTPQNLLLAAQVHAASWQDSHRAFCSETFVRAHTAQRQAARMREAMAQGARFFLLTDGSPKGVVSVQGSLIENLYILPGEQRKGYGTQRLRFAERQCGGRPTLWVLNNNTGARALYERLGYRATGRQNALNERLFELEMALVNPD